MRWNAYWNFNLLKSPLKISVSQKLEVTMYSVKNHIKYSNIISNLLWILLELWNVVDLLWYVAIFDLILLHSKLVFIILYLVNMSILEFVAFTALSAAPIANCLWWGKAKCRRGFCCGDWTKMASSSTFMFQNTQRRQGTQCANFSTTTT